MAAPGPGPIDGDAISDLNPGQAATMSGQHPDAVTHFDQLGAESRSKTTAPPAQGRILIIEDQDAQRVVHRYALTGGEGGRAPYEKAPNLLPETTFLRQLDCFTAPEPIAKPVLGCKYVLSTN
jgi:hypothetical protein